MNSHPIAFFLAAILVLTVCAQPENQPVGNTEADVEAIKNVTSQEVTAVNAGDVEALLALISNDIEIIPPNQPSVRGEQAKQWIRGFMEQSTLQMQPYSNEGIVVDGDLAFHRFSFEWTATPKEGGDSVTERGAGVHILRRQPDGSWKVAIDIWNPEAPPPAQE